MTSGSESQTNPIDVAFQYGPEILTATGTTLISSPEDLPGIVVPALVGSAIGLLTERLAGETPQLEPTLEELAPAAEKIGIEPKRLRGMQRDYMTSVRTYRRYLSGVMAKMRGLTPDSGYSDRIHDGDTLHKLYGKCYQDEFNRLVEVEELYNPDSDGVAQVVSRNNLKPDLWVAPSTDQQLVFTARKDYMAEVCEVGNTGLRNNIIWRKVADLQPEKALWINGRDLSYYDHPHEAYITYECNGFNRDYENFIEEAEEGIKTYQELNATLQKLPRRKHLPPRRKFLNQLLTDDDIPLEIKWVQVKKFSDDLCNDLEEQGIIVVDSSGEYTRAPNSSYTLENQYPSLDIKAALKLIHSTQKSDLRIINIASSERQVQNEQTEAEIIEPQDFDLRKALIRVAGVATAGVSAFVTSELVKRGIHPALPAVITSAIAGGGAYAFRRRETQIYEDANYIDGGISTDDLTHQQELVETEFTGQGILERILKNADVVIDSADGSELAHLSQIIGEYLGYFKLNSDPLKLLERYILEGGKFDFRFSHQMDATIKDYSEVQYNPFGVMVRKLNQLNKLKNLISQAPSRVKIQETTDIEMRIAGLETAINGTRILTLLQDPDIKYQMLKNLIDLEVKPHQLSEANAEFSRRNIALLEQHEVSFDSVFTFPGYLSTTLLFADQLKSLLTRLDSTSERTARKAIWQEITDLTTLSDEDGNPIDAFMLAYGQVNLGNNNKPLSTQQLITNNELREYNLLVRSLTSGEGQRTRINDLPMDFLALANINQMRTQGKHFWRNASSLLTRLGNQSAARYISQLNGTQSVDEIQKVLTDAMFREPQNLHQKIANRIITLSIEDLNTEVQKAA